jgi:hypothetical protein
LVLDILGDERLVVCSSTVTEPVQKLAGGWDPFDLLA